GCGVTARWCFLTTMICRQAASSVAQDLSWFDGEHRCCRRHGVSPVGLTPSISTMPNPCRFVPAWDVSASLRCNHESSSSNGCRRFPRDDVYHRRKYVADAATIDHATTGG